MKPAPTYQGNEPFVFVSYSHADEEIVYPEIAWLQDQGINVWYDEGISGASRWRDAIAGKIAECSLFLLYVSPHSAASRVCREELDFALDRDRVILAVEIEPAELPEGMRLGISNRQALLRHELTAEAYSTKLVAAIADHLDIEPADPASTMPVVRRRKLAPRWMVPAAAMLGILIGGLALYVLAPEEVDPPATPYEDTVMRSTIDLGHPLTRHPRFGIAVEMDLSRDGSRLVYSTESADGSTLYVRDLATGETVTPDIELITPRLSPDGDRIIGAGIRSDDGLSIIHASGGSLRSLDVWVANYSYDWLSDTEILYVGSETSNVSSDIRSYSLARISHR